MGPRTVAVKKSVSVDIKQLQKLTAEPKKNLVKIKPLITKLKRADLTDSQTNQLAAIQRKMAKYMKPVRVERKPRKMSLAMRPEKIDTQGYGGDQARTVGWGGDEGRSIETEHDIVPEEARIVGAGFKPIKLPINDQIKSTMGTDRAKIMADAAGKMVLGYFQKSLDSTAGGKYHGAVMGFLNEATGMSGPLDVNNQSDPRWRVLQTTIYGYFNLADQKERQNAVGVLNMLKSGDFLKALKTLPNSSPLRGFIINDLKTIKMRTNIPIFFASVGSDFELFRFKSGKFTVGPHLFYDHVVSQQYDAKFNDKDLTWDLVPTGYTAEQIKLKGGLTGKYKPYINATLKLEISGEMPYDVQDTGDSKVLAPKKSDAVISLSFQDKSGTYARIKNLPIYYGASVTYRPRGKSLNLRGGVGVGVAETKRLGQFLVFADFGGEITKGDPAYSQSLSQFIWRAGIGVTPTGPLTGKTYPVKMYYVQTSSGQASQAGISASTIGGGVEAKLWDIKIRGEARYRKASALSLPLAGKDNVLVLLTADFSEFIHKITFGEKRK